MNPIRWQRNEQIALVIAALVGVLGGLIVGYIVYAVGQGAGGGTRFGLWLQRPLRFGGLSWAIVGAITGAAVVYVKRLLGDHEGRTDGSTAAERFFNWEYRPAILRGTSGGGEEALFVPTGGSAWRRASPVEVLESGVELSRSEFSKMFPDAPPVPKI